MTIKPTVKHIAIWQSGGTTPRTAIDMPVCAARLIASASYPGRLEDEAIVDRRLNRF